MMPTYTLVKRALDLVAAMAGTILLAPVFAAVALAVRITMGGPVLFKRQRPGRNARSFTFFKFRTMETAADDHGHLLPDAQRLTRLGKFLRSSSLDEIPQLWNVLRGEMSLVGPRPLLVAYLDRYTPEQARRHEALPGITGWAQVNGRNALSWEEKFRLDVWYVDHRSLGLDAKILWMTLVRVLRREGINHGGYATMAEYIGPTHS
jgi:lipopolysaccharide/colanic/teichoic acid biosynthesis glycosyltransferase